MSELPIHTIFGLIGSVMLIIGLFLVLTGVKIIEITQVTVKPGKTTFGVGLLILIVGIILIIQETTISNLKEATSIPTTPFTASLTPLPSTLTDTSFPTITVTPPPMPTLQPPTPDLQVEMVPVPAGGFSMGSSYWPDQDYDFAPSHKVFLDDFFIDKYEVTNYQYAQCVEVGICALPTSFGSNTREHYYDDLETFGKFPVIYVTWQDANTFCQWRDARLPTEAEWEKAAKWDPTDGMTSLFPWGGSEPTYNKVNYHSDDTTEVGKYSEGKSWVGAFNIAGNVQEWVHDYYGVTYYEIAPELNPKGPQNSEMGRVVRGGAWSSVESRALWTFLRAYFNATVARNDLGFRCASDYAQ